MLPHIPLVYPSCIFLAERAWSSQNVFVQSCHVPISFAFARAELYLRYLYCFLFQFLMSVTASDGGAGGCVWSSAGRSRDVRANPPFLENDLIQEYDASLDS